MKTRWLTLIALSFLLTACGDDATVSSGEETEDSTDKPSTDTDDPGKADEENTGDPKDPTPGKLGEACKLGTDCDDGLICENERCVAPSELGEDCDENHVCKDKTGLAICDKDGKCRIYSGEFTGCGNENVLCAEPYECLPDSFTQELTCFKAGDIGDLCDDIMAYCKTGLACDPMTSECVTPVHEGEACGKGYKCADANNECQNGICVLPVTENCDSHTRPCESETAICYDSKCIESNACESDSDCHADTYCCTEDACSVRNHCLPYGEGPRKTTNDQCLYQTEPGLFEADLQCEWSKPAEGDPYPNSYGIVTPTFVARTPHDTGTANSLIVATYIIGDWNYADEAYKYGVIRIINPETCEVMENIYDTKNYVSAGATMAIGDVDGDGYVEIYAQRSPYQPHNTTEATGGVVQFKWDKEQKKYVTGWRAISNLKTRAFGWGGLALHDINNDGIPELITPVGEVLNARTGEKLNGTQTIDDPLFATISDLDNDGAVEYIARAGDIYEWTVTKDEAGDIKSQQWVKEYPITSGAGGYTLKALGDFGTVGETPEAFDWNTKDGIAEVVSTRGIEAGKGKAQLAIHAITKKTDASGNVTKGQQRVFFIDGLYGGGAPVVGDFDKDGMPEIGVAFGDYYSVFDPRCKKDSSGNLPEGCLEENYLWKQPNQDDSSFCTGSSVFDFDGDGQIEVVYSDECYTRIYDGKTGDVLFSAKHSSRTAYEMPTIADVDNDQSAEIIMGANWERGCRASTEADTKGQYIDAIHRGIRCTSDMDCTSKHCENNFCRCESNDQCNWRKDKDGNIKEEYLCTSPQPADKAINSKNVCRAYRKTGNPPTGLRVMRDRYDRWASARNIWNQFAYSITNINDNQTIPNITDWEQNFLQPNLNNYRANAQGKIGMNAAPDITGKLNNDSLCKRGQDNTITLTGVVCNRGTKTVASKMPASFYQVADDDTLGQKFCTAYTSSNVPTGGCLEVSCTLSASDIPAGTKIRMISNDDGEGGRTTVECNSDNNTDEIILESCPIL